MIYHLLYPLAPGDVWCLTEFLRDFAEQYPKHGVYVTTVRNEILKDNPHVLHEQPVNPDMTLKFTFNGISTTPERWRFGNTGKIENMVSVFYDWFNAETGLKVKRKTFAPEAFLSQDARAWTDFPPDRPVCVINAGYKFDNTSKFWGRAKFQAVVDALKDRVTFVQVGRRLAGYEFHNSLNGVVGMLGRTSLLELARQVYHADFVLSGISQLLPLGFIDCYKPRHVLIVAGAREPRKWADCHRRDGVTCDWFSSESQFQNCMEPGLKPGAGCWVKNCKRTPPACMEAISPAEIIAKMEDYLK